MGWTALWLGLLASPLLAIVWAKRRRRHARHSATDPRARVEGAWREIRDALVDHGTVASDSQTRLEVAALTQIPAATTVAVLADTAQYSTDQISDAEVTKAWADVDTVVTGLNTNLTRWQKILARISIKSFGLTWARLTDLLPKRR